MTAHADRRVRLLGVLPLCFFLVHTVHYVRCGGLGNMLWMCNIGNLLLAVGLMAGRPALVRIAVYWLIPGLPLWLWFVVLRGGWLMTSTLAHVGGLAVGVFALIKIGTDRRTWFYAIVWFLAIQQVSRWATPRELNVNLAHLVTRGFEALFSVYWQFWLATTLVAAGGLWLMGAMLMRLLPRWPGRAS